MGTEINKTKKVPYYFLQELIQMAKYYLQNNDLLREIHKSKTSWCEYISDEYKDYHQIVDSTMFPMHEGVIYRVLTYEHIPILRPNHHNVIYKYERVNFKPFKHIMKKDGKVITLGWSHMKDGEFSTEHGRITDNLAEMYMKLVENISRLSNFRNYRILEDMKSEAIFEFCRYALKFEEMNSGNPFSYYTTMVKRSFINTIKQDNERLGKEDAYIEAMVAKMDQEALEASGNPETLAEFFDRSSEDKWDDYNSE